MYKPASRQQIAEMYNRAKERISSFHLRHIANIPGNVFLISTAYPGVWMEHAFDGLCYARSFAGEKDSYEVAKNQLLLFIRNRLPNGHLPYNVLDLELLKQKPQYRRQIGYGQLQECVSFGSLCWDVFGETRDREFLKEAYEALTGWDGWLCTHRMTTGRGLIEMFCVYDTGHDNSGRFAGIPNSTPDTEGTLPADNPALPILAPDMNAVFFGDRMALSKMAGVLGDAKASEEWLNKAEEVRRKMFELLRDEDEEYFFDVDAHGCRRPDKSISITNVFTEGVLTQAQFDRVYERHMLNPEEFGTPYRFPSVAYNAGFKDDHAEKNCWGYFSQALTALRCQRWMDNYGRSADYDALLKDWVDVYAQQTDKPFSQELDPITGEPTDCSKWYSSAMLLYIYAVDRLKLLD